eukprot:CAMPEP_0178793240 /NCGR_PEP_ID=MMETSP0745-20121128/8960_1 /TAXON_ID=913974 /ORGANISM="Nitzschia punctata, Strain CCMP561" /LENGTH=187 /DNA_ID=CAMNT_0020451499 /DNA_START=738 /DNA_END=1298 /DNA_ORIENTATION=+
MRVFIIWVWLTLLGLGITHIWIHAWILIRTTSIFPAVAFSLQAILTDVTFWVAFNCFAPSTITCLMGWTIVIFQALNTFMVLAASIMIIQPAVFIISAVIIVFAAVLTILTFAPSTVTCLMGWTIVIFQALNTFMVLAASIMIIQPAVFIISAVIIVFAAVLTILTFAPSTVTCLMGWTIVIFQALN